MRFFDTNFLFKNLGGTYTASSGAIVAYLAFDESNKYSWASNGQSNNSDSIYLERVLPASTPMNRIFIKNTNITDATIEVDIGAGYVSLATATSFTLIKSNAGDNYFYELDNSLSITRIKITGSNTLIANREKTIQQVLGFSELGIILNNQDIQPKRNRIQSITKLNSGKVDVINKGRDFAFKVKLKAHYNTADNALINTLLQREGEVWIWLNNNLENIIVMPQEPYRFQDIYKVAFQKSDSVQFSNNAFFSGIDVTFNFVEVA